MAPLLTDLPLDERLPTRLDPRLVVGAALIAVYVIWGSTYLAMRVALESFPPFRMAGSRFLIAGAVLYAGLRLRGARAPTRREWWACTKAGVLLLVVGNGAVAFAQQWVSSSFAAIVVSTMPLWAAAFSALWGQHPSRIEWLGLTLGLAGAVVLNLDGEVGGHGFGPLVLLLAPMSWALGATWSRHLPLPPGGMTVAGEMIAGGAVMLVLSACLGERFPGAPSAASVAAFVYLIAFGSLVGFSAFTYLLRSTRPAVATSYAYVNPLVAVGLGVGVGGEHVGPQAWLGGAIILGAVAMISLGTKRP